MARIQKSMPAKEMALRTLLYFVVSVICIVILYPYFVMVCTALKSRAEIFSVNGTVLPQEALWSNFTDIWQKAPMAQYMLNSLMIAGGSTLIAMLCGIPAAYALARMKFKGQTAFLGFIIVSQMFAPVVLLIGIYKVMQSLALTNSVIGLIFINAAFNQAFTIWLLRGTFLSISAEMEQAATIDGCNRIQAMFKILLPVAAPGIVTTLIFIFINAWNEYTVALCLISTDTLKPLTVGINIFNGYNIIEWQYLFAASIFAIIPVVIMFMSISAEMEQAATIDGCNRIQAMFKVLLPMAAPGIVTTLIFIFINAWNEYTVALCLISTDTLKPLTVGINIFNGYNIIEWQYLFAGSIFAIIPVVIMFMSIEKNLTEGLTSGGVKG